MAPPAPPAAGWWIDRDGRIETGTAALRDALYRVRHPVYLLPDRDGGPAVGRGGHHVTGTAPPLDAPGATPLRAVAPPLPPERLGEAEFRLRHGLRYAYVVGAMANGITSARMVSAAGEAGCMGFFGAAGLNPAQVEAALEQIQTRLGRRPYGCNLIHSPQDPALEAALVDLYLRRGVGRISASAYMDITLPLVDYRTRGIRRDGQGRIFAPNQVVAKVSRVEVARRFLAPPPDRMLAALVERGRLSPEQADWARRVPMAQDLTAEADSGGHTDNRPAITLLPTLLALRDRMRVAHGYTEALHIGLGGGIATPEAAAAAFSMGAAYIVTGSVNQACIEAGTSPAVRRLLAQAQQADVIMAPAADMFELGVKVQVLKRGTMFALRASKLYDIYSRCGQWADVPPDQRAQLERDLFRCSFEEYWQRTRAFFEQRDPRQIERAEKQPRHKMALVFRAYLGLSSKWAVEGAPDRQIDYQVWCGPAMGAFNAWVQGTFLEPPENRRTVDVARNLLLGAAVTLRMGWLRGHDVTLPHELGQPTPQPPDRLAALLDDD